MTIDAPTLSKDSAISIGLAITILVGALWIKSGVSQLEAKLDLLAQSSQYERADLSRRADSVEIRLSNIEGSRFDEKDGKILRNSILEDVKKEFETLHTNNPDLKR